MLHITELGCGFGFFVSDKGTDEETEVKVIPQESAGYVAIPYAVANTYQISKYEARKTSQVWPKTNLIYFTREGAGILLPMIHRINCVYLIFSLFCFNSQKN